MLSFSQHLEEGRIAPLYHASNINQLSEILKNNSLEPRSNHATDSLLMKGSKRTRVTNYGAGSEHEIRGVSATRDINLAKKWRAPDNGFLQLDQRKLTHNYRLVPIQYWSGMGYARLSDTANKNNEMVKNEYEEFILTEKPIRIIPYIQKVFLNSATSMGGYVEIIQKECNLLKIPVEFFH